MSLYGVARKLNAQRKKYLKARAGTILSPVRRIEFVYPPAERCVAMTFDDGPCAAVPAGKSRGLTEGLLDVLDEFGAKGTFDVIGSTAGNYPDTEGEAGKFTWSGVSYDHYPRFGEDAFAGAVNQPELVERILAEGHELTNHSYSHRLFGPMRAVYGSRRFMGSLDEVTADLGRLHELIRAKYGYSMRLGRPPHYIDRIPGGGTAYDAYRALGYNYMAASFDGAGWLPLESCDKEVEAMVAPLRAALERDPDSLRGKIIFQKDGCNMAMRMPVADALGKQLELLKAAGYRVVTVSELLALSPFEDVDPASEEFPYIRALLDAGHTAGYRNNRFYGERPVTADEFCVMAAKPETLRFPRPADFRALAAAARASGAPRPEGEASGNALLGLAMKAGVPVTEKNFRDKKRVERRFAAELLAGLAAAGR